MAFEISQRVKVSSPVANIDENYGPWSSSAAAASSISEATRTEGLTVGVLTSGSVVEYWWKAATGDSDLVRKLVTVQDVKTSFNVQTLTIPSSTAATTPLEIAATTDIVKIVRSADWTPASVTGFVQYKPIVFHITTGSSGTAPYQIVFPSNIKRNDGVEPFFKNNSSTSYDELIIRGIEPASGQITGDITFGQ